MKKFTVMILLGIAAMIISHKTTAQGIGSTSISATFTSADIPAGRNLWFAATVKITGTPTYPLTIHFRNQTISCTAFSFSVPDGDLILDPSYTHPVSSFNGTTWITTAPPNEPGNYFIAAGQYLSPLVPGGQKPVTWSGTFIASRSGISINWQWWSASYYGFNGPIYEDGVKACDCSSCTQWAGTDHAGTPEYVNTEHDLSGLNVFTGGGTGYSYTDSAALATADPFVPIALVSTSATSICAGDSVTFTASAINGGVTPSWQWKKNGVNVGSNSSTYTALSLVNHDTISVVLTSNDPLASPLTVVSNSIVVAVKPGFTVSGTLTSPTCNGYTNGSVVTSVTPRRGHTYTYAWSNSSTSFGLWGVGAGTYTLTAKNEAGCTITRELTVTQPSPLASTHSVTDAYPRGGNNGAVYYGVSGGTWPYTYSWSNGATTQNITGLTAGSYLVTVTDANSCNLTNWFSVGQPGGFGARMAGNSGANIPAAEAYPNPFSTESTIAFSTPHDGQTTVEVYNAVSGVKEATIFNDNTKAGQDYSCKLSGAQLASGVYCYKIISADNELYTGRVVLVK
jgi:hypothetical protein